MNPRTFLIGTLVALVLGPTFSTAQNTSDFRLQPLPYNDPDLVVDLGVGLWAWPMPLDYDNDGDMDLLVACPDKPSRGVYFFENPSQDRHQDQPVFLPGKHVGPAHQNMMLSWQGDQAVILRPGWEYHRDSATGQFDFNSPTKIAAPTNPHAGPGVRIRGNMWRYVDFDGDGIHDLAAGIGDWTELGWDHAYDQQGVWQNGPLHGFVYISMNRGTNEHPKYAPATRLTAAGSDVDVYGWPCPNFADFDGDGDLDLLCGEFLDGFTYFQNTGTRSKPEYAAGCRLADESGSSLAMHVQMITPTAVDWDGDGDMDLVVGDEDGRVALLEHSGAVRDGIPIFSQPTYFRQKAETLKFGALATPVAFDWDNDGDEDIVCGNTAGSIGWFENQGIASESLPKWSAPKLLMVNDALNGKRPFRIQAGPTGSIQGPCEAKWGYTTFSIADWDGDGDGDIIYNSILGRIGMLENDSGVLTEQLITSAPAEMPPKWYWSQSPSVTTLTQWRTTPVATDFDQNDTLDLVLLDQEGFLTIRREAGLAERAFVDEDLNPIRLNAGSCGRSGRVKLCVVDWDQDGRLDLLVNSENATWYRNCKSIGNKTILKRIGNLARRNVSGHTSSPSVCDFDQDGKPDLLVGSENGRIYHVRHDDCVQYSAKQLVARSPKSAPKKRVPGLVGEEFVFTKPPFQQCHASTICKTTRGLVAAWFGGTKEGNPDVGIWVSYHDGLRWSNPIQVADGVQHDDKLYPCWNPVLFQPPGDGPTLLFFKVGPNPREWWGELMVSYDRGRTFVNRRRLPEGIDGPVRCKPILLPNQTLLCGSSTEFDGWRIHFESVELSNGMPESNWKRVGPINDASQFNAIQPTFLQHDDGRLQVLCRTKESCLVTSFSTDAGTTWSPLEKTNLPNPNSGIESVSLADGRHLLVYNHLGAGKSGWGRRGMLNLAISDNGRDWFEAGILEQEAGAEFSYPAIIQSDDGLVHVTYTWKRSRIKHLTLNPDKLSVGRAVNTETRFD